MPKLNFTAATVNGIKAPIIGREEYWDQNLTGFWLRVTSSGRKTWGITYRHQRRLRRLTIGPYPLLSLADARDKARALLHDAAMGRDPVSDKQSVLNGDTFAELAEAYIRDYAKPRKRSWKEDRRALDRDLLPRFRNRKASEIKRREVIDLLRDIKGRGAPILANRTLEIIRRIYNWGVSNDFVEINPCIGIEKPSQENQRDKVLSETEICDLWRALEQEPLQIGSRYKLQLLTAQRSGEVRQMRWGDIDLDTGWWTIPEQFSKNRRSHRVPLSEMAIQILEEIATATADNEWVFPSPTAEGAVRSNTKASKRIRKRSGIDFQPHDLRRTAASKMAGELGVDRLTLSKILNHVETGVTAIYDRHSYDKEKRAALKDWSNYLNQTLNRVQPYAVAS